MPLWVLFQDTRSIFSKDELNSEIAKIAIPATFGLMADPIASLVDTAFIGHLGPVELAAVGVAIAVFNQASKIAIFPLVSVTTSFVAEEDSATSSSSILDDIELQPRSKSDNEKMLLLPKHGPENTNKRRHVSSASSALLIGAMLGLIQAFLLIVSAKPLLSYMGIKSDSPMLSPAYKYLTLRSLGAPAVLLSLAMQGVFRGFKDTKTPLYAIVMGGVVNIVLDPILIFVFKMRVTGAAIAHVCSQYLISVVLLWKLIEQVDLLPPNINDLQLGRFLKNGFLLLVRVIAATFCVTLAASLSARLGSTEMAAFQVCLQVWLAASLLTDGLAVAGQAILAGAFARQDYESAKETAGRVLQLSLALGLVLAFIVGVGLTFSSGLFTKDVKVLQILSLGIPFVAATQPINSLAFVFDGINYGASDFRYSAFSMVLVAFASVACLLLLSSYYGFVGIWVALSIFMSLRAIAGVWRIGTASGPWSFLNIY
ncbi:putative multi antimicrobial extrusion protein [Helianthus annuus]|uniref:Protein DETOXIFICATION n=2 Tax=Helianthus annuus TaxID=4232 RepID=A0A251UT79_HELAN|nr:protein DETOXIFICATION 42 isoform X3 [Helianthus annuus]KAF5807515.1 putative multi antimicrobial extrusion protein [Helianthus annuus]